MTNKAEEDESKETTNLVQETAILNESKFKCNPKLILQAVSVLRQLNEKYYETCEKKPFLDDVSDNSIFLQISLKKIPALKWRQCIKVRLPNPLVKDKTEICLITGDLDKRNTKAEIEPDVLHYKELLKSQNITQISEVITLRQLRTEYKSFEARRNLYGAYDIFLCDKKIAGVLPKVLGKFFYGGRKIPIQINMNVKNLKDTIDYSLKNTVLHLTCRGNCCVLEVASLSMKDDEILNNISSSIDIFKDKIPGQVANIMGLHVKTARSKALPIYMSFDNPNDVNVKKRKFKKEKVEAEDITTVIGAKVKVFKSGRVIVNKLKSKRKSSHKSMKNEKSKIKRNIIEKDSTSKLKKVKKEKVKKIKKSVELGSDAVKKSKTDVLSDNKLVKKTVKIKKNFKADNDKGERNLKADKKLKKNRDNVIQEPKPKKIKTSK